MSWRWWVNGTASTAIDAMDRGLAYGDGLFETIAVRQGRPRFIDLHLERLLRGCTRLGIPPPERRPLQERLLAVARDVPHGTLKLVITRGPGERGYAPPANPRPTILYGIIDTLPLSAAPAEVTLCATRVAIQPATAGLKSLNRLEQVLARAEWRDERIFEGLMRDTSDDLVGGTMSNLFIVTAGKLRTPDLSRAGIHGIMRQVIIGQARLLGIPCDEVPMSVPDLESADEVFVSNALIGLRPVVALGDRHWPVGPCTNRLRRQLAELGVGECAAPC